MYTKKKIAKLGGGGRKEEDYFLYNYRELNKIEFRGKHKYLYPALTGMRAAKESPMRVADKMILSPTL